MSQERREKGLFWDKAWKLVEGCTKISPGCENCWSETETVMHCNHPNDKIRERAREVSILNVEPRGELAKWRFNGSLLLRKDNLELPLRTRKPTVFAVWNDLYHTNVEPWFHLAAYRTMAQCPQHTFLVITKRAERLARFTAGGQFSPAFCSHKWPLDNVWHIVTCEDQPRADERIAHLLRVPGKRGVLIEPMLGPVDLMNLERPWEFHTSPYGWPQWLGKNLGVVMLGGESGPNARPMHPDWARSVRDQCAAAGVPFFFKSWGEWVHIGLLRTNTKTIYLDHGGTEVSGEAYSLGLGCSPERIARVGKKAAGRILDGAEHNDLPWDILNEEKTNA